MCGYATSPWGLISTTWTSSPEAQDDWFFHTRSVGGLGFTPASEAQTCKYVERPRVVINHRVDIKWSNLLYWCFQVQLVFFTWLLSRLRAADTALCWASCWRHTKGSQTRAPKGQLHANFSPLERDRGFFFFEDVTGLIKIKIKSDLAAVVFLLKKVVCEQWKCRLSTTPGHW